MGPDDMSMDAAVAKILAKGPEALGDGPAREDKRENRTDREPFERADSGDLDENLIDGEEETLEASADDPAETKEGGEQPSGEEDAAFLEIPGAEGAEAERIPLAEAVEAVKQYRQIQSDIANVVNKAEVEAQTRADAALNEVLQMHAVARQEAEAILASLPRPQRPHQALLDERSQYYNPQEYHLQMLDYEQAVRTIESVKQDIAQATKGQQEAAMAAVQKSVEREHERLGRYWPEWKDEKTRGTVQASLYAGLEKHYGLSKDVLDRVPFDHRILRLVKDAVEAKEIKAKAPEIKKKVQESAAKIVNGRASPQRAPDGRFISEARKGLKEQGTEAAFASFLLKSGALRGL